MRVHLDTDFGGDPDDACALAMLLGWPNVEIVGITTSIDSIGLRAAYVRYVLSLIGREDIPVAAGAAVSMTTRAIADPFIDGRYWPADLAPCVASPGAALDLLSHSLDLGARVIAIGPYTNLALLEIARPGSLRRVPLTVMGGWVEPLGQGFPAWGPDADFNVQWDVQAAEIVAQTSDVTLSPIKPSLKATLRAADLPRLRASGPLGTLLAHQSELYAVESGMTSLGQNHDALPDDLLNVHWDPVACAVALGWSGASIRKQRLSPAVIEGVLRFMPNDLASEMGFVADIDGEAFRETWISAVEAAQYPRI